MLDNKALRFVLDSLPDAVLLCGANGVILDGNVQCESLLGYPPHELIGLPVEALVPAGLRPGHAGLRERFMKDPCRRPMDSLTDLSALRKDGQLQPVSIALSPVKVDTRHLIIVCLRDNSQDMRIRQRERAYYERTLKAQRLENLGMLSCGIAHDLKNMLTVVMGNAELALLNVRDDGMPLRENLLAIQTASGHLQELCWQMMNYAQGMDMRRQQVFLNDTVEAMSALLRGSLPVTTHLCCELTDGLPPLETDSGQISQILLNLILNANEAIGAKGGCITVRTGSGDSSVFVEVVDNGTGIDEEVLAKILDPFFTTKDGGKGLGLSVVRDIAQRLGAVLHINSRPAEGAVFRVEFPLVFIQAGAAADNSGVDGPDLRVSQSPTSVTVQ